MHIERAAHTYVRGYVARAILCLPGIIPLARHGDSRDSCIIRGHLSSKCFLDDETDVGARLSGARAIDLTDRIDRDLRSS